MNLTFLQKFLKTLTPIKERIRIPDGSTNSFILLLIILFALIVRFLGIGKGLPYIHNFDEPFIASTALEMLRNGDFNPHWFFYPGFMMYSCFVVDIFHYLYLVGQSADSINYINDLNDIVINKDTGWNWTISHPSFYLWNRGLVAIFGSIAVYLTFLIGKEVSQKNIVGLISAGFVAVSSVLIHHSRLITPNMAGVLFVLGTVYFSIKFNSTKDKIHLLYSLIFTGLAIATKYNYAICMIIPMFSYLANAKSIKLNYAFGIIFSFLIPIGIFFLLNPYALIDFDNFLVAMGRMIRHYKVNGHGSHSIEPGIPHLIFQIGMFKKEFGVLLMALSAIGMLLSLKLRNGWLLLLFPTIYLAYMTRQRVDFHRNFIAMYPFIALWISLAICFLSNYLMKIIEVFRHKISNPKLRHYLANSPYIVITLVILLFAKAEMGKAVNLSNQRETRSQTIDKINELTKGVRNSTKIAIAKELRVHQQDLRRLKINYDIIDHLEFSQEPTKYKYFISGLYSHPKQFSPKQDSVFNAEYLDNPVVHEIKGKSKIRLKVFSDNPTVLIYDRKEIPYNSISPKSFEGISPTTKHDINATTDTYVGANGGEYSTPNIDLDPGRYNLSVISKGNLIRNETAKLNLFIGDHLLIEIKTDTLFSESNIEFEIDTLQNASLRLNYINDFWSPQTNEDRNFYLRDLRIQKIGN